MPGALLKQWTAAEIDAECAGAYGRFKAARTAGYVDYFAKHPELANPAHTYEAKDFASALPDASPLEFAQWLPKGERHRYHLSGNSSQMLALGVLGTAARRNPSLDWWWEALDVPGPSGPQPKFKFEAKLAKEVLGESGGPTTLDFFTSDEATVICCECKWVEQGVGACTCQDAKLPPDPDADPSAPPPAPGPVTGRCRPAIYKTDAYWHTAAELFELPKHPYGQAPCRLGYAYQAVRNVAAALALAGPERRAVFALVYDGTNPYFAGCGEWPGWPTVLQHTLDGAHPHLEFRARSWQQLVGHLPLDPVATAWAAEKHGLS